LAIVVVVVAVVIEFITLLFVVAVNCVVGVQVSYSILLRI